MEIVPYEARIVVPIREMDNQFIQIQELIDAKRKLLINKQKKLRFISKQNRFLEAVKNLHQSMDCIIRYGSCFGTSTHKIDDCITGLIGMRCFYLKLIQFPLEHECAEWKWAQTANTIHHEKIHSLDRLGIDICPGTDDYFTV